MFVNHCNGYGERYLNEVCDEYVRFSNLPMTLPSRPPRWSRAAPWCGSF
jgi:hypothetical protein